MNEIKLTDDIYYVGTNDRKKHLFENNWPLPNGVAYNSYLIKDNKSAVIDTLEFGSKPDYFEEIDSILDGRQLDYIIVNHLEPDHSSMIGLTLEHYPEAKIVSNKVALKLLGEYYTVPEERTLCVGEADCLELGSHSLSFVMIPWVHWPETMITYEKSNKVAFTCDAFGSFGALDGAVFDDETDYTKYDDEMRRYYSNIVGKYSLNVQKAFDKLSGTEIRIIAPSHGLIWRTNTAHVLDLYHKWCNYESEKGVVVAFASMYGNTEKMADFIARKLAENGIKKIKVFDVSKTHVSFILSEIWKYNGLILGSCAYNGDMHPQMSFLCHELSISNPKGKVFSIFGSSTWNGAGYKALSAFAEKQGWEITGPAVQNLGRATDIKISGLEELAKDFASKL